MIVIIILGFNKVFNIVNYYYVQGGGGDHESRELAIMVNSVIGIPYAQKPEFKNDASGITRLTKEEWFALPYLDTSLTIDFVADEEELLAEPMPQPSEVQHAQALRLVGALPFVNTPNKPIYRELCPTALTCRLLTIAVQNYALHRPEILENIIKIAERPCDYIRSIEEVKPGNAVVFVTTEHNIFEHKFVTLKYPEEDIKWSIGEAKKFLGCKKSKWNNFFALNSPSFFKKKFVLIVINKTGFITNKDEKSVDIIVARKDI